MKYFKLTLLLCGYVHSSTIRTGTTKFATTTTTVPTAVADIDIRKYMNISVQEQKERDIEDLTPRSFAALFDRSETVDEDGKETGYDAKHDKWEVTLKKIESNANWVGSKDPVGSHSDKLLSCYFIGVTYKNAIQDIRQYYQIRYLYANNLDYEVGYLVEEIIVHYQIAVELYHLMMVKYGGQRDRFLTPMTYMLYIYINILNQCKTIIHLCNMLHELEEKYRNGPYTIFSDKSGSKSSFNMTPPEDPEIKIVAQRKRELKALQKERKKLFKSGLTPSRNYGRPKKGPFYLHYGWSIENW